MPTIMPFIIAIFFIGIIVLGIFSYISAKKRREAMAALAARLGLRFDTSKDREIARRYRFLNQLCQGDNRYALNTLSGSYKGNEITAFDYHYETHSTDSKGHHHTHHHYFSFFMLFLPLSFPELVIVKEGLFSKIGQALGYDDIDFESHEFSRKFCVRSKDKKFAYDICNAQMIEYLLSNTDLSIEIEDNVLALYFPNILKAEQIEHNLERLIAIRSLMPEYLFSKR